MSVIQNKILGKRKPIFKSLNLLNDDSDKDSQNSDDIDIMKKARKNIISDKIKDSRVNNK